MGIYLKEIYKMSSEGKDVGKDFVKYMQETVYNDRLPLLLPKDLKVAHKIGNYAPPLSFHDVGIIYTKNPYILAIMTKEVAPEKETFPNIANISKIVYDYQIKLNAEEQREKEQKKMEDERKHKN